MLDIKMFGGRLRAISVTDFLSIKEQQVISKLGQKLFFTGLMGLLCPGLSAVEVQETAKELPKKGRFGWARRNPVKTLGIFAGVLVSLFFGKRRYDGRHVRALENANERLKDAYIQISKPLCSPDGKIVAFGGSTHAIIAKCQYTEGFVCEKIKPTFSCETIAVLLDIAVRANAAFEDAKKSFENQLNGANLTSKLRQVTSDCRALTKTLDLSECITPDDVRGRVHLVVLQHYNNTPLSYANTIYGNRRDPIIKKDPSNNFYKAIAQMRSAQYRYAYCLFVMRDEVLAEFLSLVMHQVANANQ